MKGRVNLWVNLYDDLQLRPVMTEAIDSQRDDLTNVVELQDGKRFIYLRGNVSVLVNLCAFELFFLKCIELFVRSN